MLWIAKKREILQKRFGETAKKKGDARSWNWIWLGRREADKAEAK